MSSVRPVRYQIFAEDVDEAAVYCRSDVVELGDEGMFEPIDQHLGEEDDQDRRKDAVDDVH